MVVFISLDALASVVNVDIVLLKLLQNVYINGSWINTDVRSWDL